MVCALFDHTDDFNMFQTQVEPRAAGEWFHGKVLNILMSFLWSIRLKKQNYVHLLILQNILIT